MIPYKWKGRGVYAPEPFEKCCKSISPDMALVIPGYQYCTVTRRKMFLSHS